MKYLALLLLLAVMGRASVNLEEYEIYKVPRAEIYSEKNQHCRNSSRLSLIGYNIAEMEKTIDWMCDIKYKDEHYEFRKKDR